MNAEIKALWIADLRANPDKQGKGALALVYNSGTDQEIVKNCCLGRLCMLAPEEVAGPVKQRITEVRDVEDQLVLSYDGDMYFPSHAVYRWAGMGDVSSDEPVLPFTMRDMHWAPARLSMLNDGGLSFGQIADVIEYFL